MGCRRLLMPFAQRKKTTCRRGSDLKPKERCAHAVAALDQHLTIPIQSSLTQTGLFRELVGMATMSQSVHLITRLLEQVSCETSFCYHLKKLAIDNLEQKNNAILTSLISHALKSGNAYRFAIDYTNDLYYGTTSAENEPFIIEANASNRQPSSYSHVTLYMTTRDRQMTLAVYLVRQGTPKGWVCCPLPGPGVLYPEDLQVSDPGTGVVHRPPSGNTVNE